MFFELPLRITVIQPPAGVAIQVQRGQSSLLPPTRVTAEQISFDFQIRASAGPRLLGEYVQGPPHARFVYVNSGVRAGQIDSCWDRRAKISLMSITTSLIELVKANPRLVLEARVAGLARDLGPLCASVALLDGGWQAVRITAPPSDPETNPRREERESP